MKFLTQKGEKLLCPPKKVEGQKYSNQTLDGSSFPGQWIKGSLCGRKNINMASFFTAEELEL